MAVDGFVSNKEKPNFMVDPNAAAFGVSGLEGHSGGKAEPSNNQQHHNSYYFIWLTRSEYLKLVSCEVFDCVLPENHKRKKFQVTHPRKGVNSNRVDTHKTCCNKFSPISISKRMPGIASKSNAFDFKCATRLKEIAEERTIIPMRCQSQHVQVQ